MLPWTQRAGEQNARNQPRLGMRIVCVVGGAMDGPSSDQPGYLRRRARYDTGDLTLLGQRWDLRLSRPHVMTLTDSSGRVIAFRGA
jgi:hypothetical protein